MVETEILSPVTALIAWTMVMWFWMYKTRIPSIIRLKMRLDPYAPKGEQMNSLPAEVRWKADNYNHLMEQPTLFYALCMVLALKGHGNGLNTQLAWGYVGTRVIHSFVQSLGNVIRYRFLVFTISSFFLITMIIRTVILEINF